MKKNVLFLLLAVVLSAGTSQAEDDPALHPTMDALERKLEMGRHLKLTALKANPASVLEQFTTDGCSGGLSAGWHYLAGKIEKVQTIHGAHPPWESCCINHDLAYHTAADRTSSATQSFSARREADLLLRTCVLETGVNRAPELSTAYNLSEREIALMYTAIGDLMYRAVRIGGMPCTGLPWRWGYGWPECAEEKE